VGSARHRGPLGSDPGRKTAWAGFAEMSWARSVVETGREDFSVLEFLFHLLFKHVRK
jgi:hypothetical protein